MKRFAITIGYFLWLAMTTASAQSVNWRALDGQRVHYIAANFGADYGTFAGLSAGQKISNTLPILVGVEFTVPFGKDLLDDWKLKLVAQGELWHNESFSVALKPAIIIRRFESEIARVYNISAEGTLTAGYLRPKWGIAAEANYDHSLSANIKHKLLKEYYPEIRDGWYGSTGGNFKFGVAANYTFPGLSIFLKAGKVYGQDFKHNPTLPFYADVSVVKYFGF